MKKKFMRYLERQGYSVETPSGKPSTIGDYAKRVGSVCKRERTSWEGLAKNIEVIVRKYDAGGSEQDFGNTSHRAVINALKRYREFLLNG